MGNLYALELSIIPLKKPILDKSPLVEVLKPKPKPNKKTKEVKEVKISNEENKIKKTKINFLIPKSKPLIVKKSSSIAKKKSKYYSQRDFDIAKKSIQAIEKSQWTSGLSISKRAKDKSIYNFIQWRHLLTSGNQASFYDYMQVFMTICNLLEIMKIIQELIELNT